MFSQWRGHFEGVFYVESSFNITNSIIREEKCDPPTGDEGITALSRLKVGKAAGSNGLLPDIVSVVVALCQILLCHCLVQCGGRDGYPWNDVMQL